MAWGCWRGGRSHELLPQEGDMEEEDGEGSHREAALSAWRHRCLVGRLMPLGLASLFLLGAATVCVLFHARYLPGLSAVAHVRSQLHTAVGSQPLTDFSAAWQLAPFCNASIAIRQVRHAVAFDLEPHWKVACQKINPPPGNFFTSHWAGQDTCWAWVKKVGCYESVGTLSWRDGQKKAALGGFAPEPSAQLMSGLRSPDICEHSELGVLSATPSLEESRAAAKWFRDNVGVYIINLDRDVKRLKDANRMFRRLNLTFTRIPGVDLSEPGGLDLAYRDGLVPSGFSFSLAQMRANSSYQGMGGILGTAGCAAAHLNAMREVVEDLQPARGEPSAKPLALILEDDVVLRDDFAVKLRRLLHTEAPCDWEALSLRSMCPYGTCISPHLTRVEPDGNEPADRCRHGVNYGFLAMLYQVRRLSDVRTRLAKTVWDDERPRCLDVDVALASISDQVAYYAVPAMQRPGFVTLRDETSSRFALNSETTLSPSTTLASTATSTTATLSAHFPAAPFRTEQNQLPLLVLGDGHYTIHRDGSQGLVSEAHGE
uniref:Glycosyl transferase family 25 domain-containing protein n=1 Tax=Alexandrium monilatum TaxID=311494 RepID=A0A7S4R271_9DINO|mmetsp:Transcript_7113/g.21673  ORF Transcript_7113/g.21673 Transcript_7113/m.21673 type:complete len:543 (+) Transcript_7113:110-1738(+)